MIGDKLFFDRSKLNSYFSSITADFIRQRLIKLGQSFTFETVMSHKDKIEILNQAKNLGYKIYLYYIATEDPEINISRVKNRVQKKGHPVPENKIIERYTRSLQMLTRAIKISNRAYIFDNSAEGVEKIWIAEITNGSSIEVKVSNLPNWFEKAVLDKI